MSRSVADRAFSASLRETDRTLLALSRVSPRPEGLRESDEVKSFPEDRRARRGRSLTGHHLGVRRFLGCRSPSERPATRRQPRGRNG